MLFKIIVVLFILVILYCLFSGLYFLVKKGQASTQLVTALTWRIVLSMVLFGLILLAFWMGWITPQPSIDGIPVS